VRRIGLAAVVALSFAAAAVPALASVVTSSSPRVEAGVQGRAEGRARAGGARAGAAARGRGVLNDIPAGATPAEVEQLLDRYVRAQARAALQLTPGQMQTFGPGLGRLLAVRRQVQRERQRLLRELADVSRAGGPADETAMAARLAALEDQRVRGEGAIRDAMMALDQTLTVPQRARFRIFERRMEQLRVELLARARRAARGAAPPTPPVDVP
jgi:hypothetical protein